MDSSCIITSPDKNFPQKINLIVNWDTSDNRYTFNTQIQGIPLNMGRLNSMSSLFHAALLREHVLSYLCVKQLTSHIDSPCL